MIQGVVQVPPEAVSARLGSAWPGSARIGLAGHGPDRLGWVWLPAWLGSAQLGSAPLEQFCASDYGGPAARFRSSTYICIYIFLIYIYIYSVHVPFVLLLNLITPY